MVGWMEIGYRALQVLENGERNRTLKEGKERGGQQRTRPRRGLDGCAAPPPYPALLAARRESRNQELRRRSLVESMVAFNTRGTDSRCQRHRAARRPAPAARPGPAGGQQHRRAVTQHQHTWYRSTGNAIET